MTVATSFKIAVVPGIMGVSALKLEMQADPEVNQDPQDPKGNPTDCDIFANTVHFAGKGYIDEDVRSHNHMPDIGKLAVKYGKKYGVKHNPFIPQVLTSLGSRARKQAKQLVRRWSDKKSNKKRESQNKKDDQLQSSMNQCTGKIDRDEHKRRLAKAQAIQARNLKLAELIAPIMFNNRSKFLEINNSTYDQAAKYMPEVLAFSQQYINEKPLEAALLKAMCGADDVYLWFFKAYKENRF